MWRHLGLLDSPEGLVWAGLTQFDSDRHGLISVVVRFDLTRIDLDLFEFGCSVAVRQGDTA